MIYRLSLFGGFGLEKQGEPLTSFESDKVRALLAYLAVEKGQSHRRDKLVGLLWPDSSEGRARHSLSQALYSLKPLFADDGHQSCLAITSQEIHFRPQACWLDVHEFQALITACDVHGHNPAWVCRACLERLERAASLYRGDFLAGLNLDRCDSFDEWLLQKRDDFREQMIRATGQLAGGYDLLGDPETALSHARKMVDLDPLNEAHHRQVMQFLARLGQRSAALVQYETCRQILSEELGVEPEASTELLYQQILEKFPGPLEAPATRHNLPASLTPLVGRQKELEGLCLLLARPACRLVTAFGPGGVGKTRLALEAGRTLLPIFPDGIYLVELDARQKQETLAPLIARVLGLGQVTESNPLGTPARHDLDEHLFSFLQNKKLLLILDGFEGLLAESGWLSSLLRRTAGVVILTTSRVCLNLNAEQVLLLEGLPYPPQAGETGDLGSFNAVKFFLQAARRARPTFTLNTENSQHVVDICRVLEGMPLGILLAAAWVGVLEPQQIAGQIRRGLDFLTANRADLPDRQRSLRATFEYSLQLLGEVEHMAFTRLSVFRSAFSTDRASQVAQVTLSTFKILVDHSLLHPAGEGRFRIHELLRQFAQENLAHDPGEERAVRERHCQGFMTALAALEPRLKSESVFSALAEMDQEYPDLLEAWDWASEHGYIDLMDHAVWPLGRYHTVRDLFNEGTGLCQKAIDRLEAGGIGPRNLRLWVRLGTLLANFLIRQTKYESCAQVLAQIEEGLHARPGLAIGLRREQAFLQISQGEYYVFSGRGNIQALNFFQKGMDLLYGTEDAWDIGFGLWHVALGHGSIGNFRELQHFAELGLESQRPSGDPTLIQKMLNLRGYALMFSGQSAEALHTVEEEVMYLQRFNDHPHKTAISSMRGVVRYHAGLYEEARPYFEQSLALFNLPEDREEYYTFLWILDFIHLATGDYDAIHLSPYMSADDRAGIEEAGFQYKVHLTWGVLDLLRQDWAQAELNFQSFLHYQEKVSALYMIGIPLALLGLTAYRLGDIPLARARLIAALENGLKQGYYLVFCYSLGILALILAEAGQLEQAVELYATATAHPGASNARYFYDILGKPIADRARQLPLEKVEAARARGRSQTLNEAGEKYLALLKSPAGLLANLHAKD